VTLDELSHLPAFVVNRHLDISATINLGSTRRRAARELTADGASQLNGAVAEDRSGQHP
jgi:hypothetical protein